MRRHQLEHVIGAAASIVGEDDFIVVGSQAILGQFPDAPDELLRSMEADLYPARSPEKSSEIDGALGAVHPSIRPTATTRTALGPKPLSHLPAGKSDSSSWLFRLVLRLPARLAPTAWRFMTTCWLSVWRTGTVIGSLQKPQSTPVSSISTYF